MRAAVLSRTNWHLQPSRDQYSKDRFLNGSLSVIVPSVRLSIHTQKYRNKSSNTLIPKPPPLEVAHRVSSTIALKQEDREYLGEQVGSRMVLLLTAH